LIVIFFFDLKHYIIPDKVIYPAIFVSGIWYFIFGIFFNFYPKSEIRYTLYAAIGASLFFLFIYSISKGKWLGFGDVKLAFLMGLFLGFPKISVALFFSFFIGAIIGIGLILTKKKTLKSEVPFAPFLVLGTFIALFFGEKIISWYLNFFLLK
jgi:leader peptidase (prepilin peptidase)/N-methyltransferase